MTERKRGVSIITLLRMLPRVTEKEFCEHIGDDDFPVQYGNPVWVQTENGNDLICITVELYDRLTKRTTNHEKTCKYTENMED